MFKEELVDLHDEIYQQMLNTCGYLQREYVDILNALKKHLKNIDKISKNMQESETPTSYGMWRGVDEEPIKHKKYQEPHKKADTPTSYGMWRNLTKELRKRKKCQEPRKKADTPTSYGMWRNLTKELRKRKKCQEAHKKADTPTSSGIWRNLDDRKECMGGTEELIIYGMWKNRDQDSEKPEKCSKYLREYDEPMRYGGMWRGVNPNCHIEDDLRMESLINLRKQAKELKCRLTKFKKLLLDIYKSNCDKSNIMKKIDKINSKYSTNADLENPKLSCYKGEKTIPNKNNIFKGSSSCDESSEKDYKKHGCPYLEKEDELEEEFKQMRLKRSPSSSSSTSSSSSSNSSASMKKKDIDEKRISSKEYLIEPEQDCCQQKRDFPEPEFNNSLSDSSTSDEEKKADDGVESADTDRVKVELHQSFEDAKKIDIIHKFNSKFSIIKQNICIGVPKMKIPNCDPKGWENMETINSPPQFKSVPQASEPMKPEIQSSPQESEPMANTFNLLRPRKEKRVIQSLKSQVYKDLKDLEKLRYDLLNKFEKKNKGEKKTPKVSAVRVVNANSPNKDGKDKDETIHVKAYLQKKPE